MFFMLQLAILKGRKRSVSGESVGRVFRFDEVEYGIGDTVYLFPDAIHPLGYVAPDLEEISKAEMENRIKKVTRQYIFAFSICLFVCF